MLIRRFKPLRLAVPGVVATVLLLKVPKSSALSYKKEDMADKAVKHDLATLPKFKLFDGIENLKPIISSKYSKDFSCSVNYTGDFDTQLVLTKYLLHFAKHAKKSIKTMTGECSAFRSANEAYFNASEENEKLNQVFTNSRSHLVS